ncbi:NmrA family transcriptional regulator [Lophiostoma macrostomum CBS 122681]|uniref:NmrA family transcriptional regulator n=1 Tax=Lophiostoma macrostomum CBS 122681 TaxID=1314788 RepID=A0A6A6SPH5_9PLEO|nr:NmrA family transcriptional regulator [Lophiostoma macrostomum CBS 122681]
MATKKLLVVFGATGQQGNSVVTTVLYDSKLSSEYAVRAVTRDTSHPAAQALATAGAEVVSADMSDPSTLPAAVSGAHTIFLMTPTDYIGDTRSTETQQTKAVCSAAVDAGASYIIWSSLDNVTKGSNGKLTKVVSFDIKEELEQYIRTLPLKSSFYVPGSFMQNFTGNLAPVPSLTGDGTYVLSIILKPDTQLPLIDITDTGKWIASILAEPDKYEGKRLCAATRLYTLTEMVEIMSKVSGKQVTYQHLSEEAYKSSLPAQIPPQTQEWMVEMFKWNRDFGYFGQDQGEKVKWAAEQASGQLTEFEDFLRKSEFRLA